MNRIQSTLAFALVTLLVSQHAYPQPSHSTAPVAAVNKSFDFGYEVGGDPVTAPVQVFDDGERTYFQFRDTVKLLPVIFRVMPNGEREQVPFERRAPYVIVSDVNKRFFLSNGVGEASVEYVGTRPVQPRPQITVAEAVGRVAALVNAGTPAQPAAPAVVQAPAAAIAAPAPEKRIPIPPAIAAEAKPIFRDVVFPQGGTSLTPAATATLQGIIAAAEDAVGIVVYGRNDRGGSTALAQRRATAIRDFLLTKGNIKAPVNIIADVEVREDVERKGFVSSVFITPRPRITPQLALAAGLDPAVAARFAQHAASPQPVPQAPAPTPLPRQSPAQSQPLFSSAGDLSANPKVLDATASLLKQGLLTPEMATQVLMRFRESNIQGDGFRTWESSSGADLRWTLTEWVKRAGWSELVWNAGTCKATPLQLSGTFADAVGKLASAAGVEAEMYTVDKVLVVNDSNNRCKG